MKTPSTSTKRNVDENFLTEIKKSITNIEWGSLEIFIQDSKVVQITERNIKKLQSAVSGKWPIDK